VTDIDYYGLSLSELVIEDVDWTHRGDYIQQRSRRHPGDFDVWPEWATEAVFDEERLLGLDPASKSGLGIRVVGKSQQANRILVVTLIPKSFPTIDGSWWGVNAWIANTKLQRRYLTQDEPEVNSNDNKRHP
jgi:hypothetical protein